MSNPDESSKLQTTKKENGHVHNPQQHNLLPPIENASHRLQAKLAGRSRQLRPREAVIKATKD